MSPETLRNWIENPSLVDRHAQIDLRALIRQYPCFAAAQVILLKSMEQDGDLNFAEELFKTSLMVANRKALYYYIKNRPYPSEEDSTREQADFGLVDQFLEQQVLSGERLQTELPDYFQLMSYQPLNTDEEAESDSKQDLIDRFLNRHAEQNQREQAYDSLDTKDNARDEDSELSLEMDLSNDYPESSFTETLAKIYLKQGKYEKALEIFKSLLLKYPEKSIYFADQIRFLKKLIHHLK